jgi:hypothetical protein
MDLKSHVLSVLVLLTASAVPPAARDLHPRFMHGVWNCTLEHDYGYVRLAMDSDGTYRHWTVPDPASYSAGHGKEGTWELVDGLLLLMPYRKHLILGDGEDRDELIRSLEERGFHYDAEELARTLHGWIPVNDEESATQGFRIELLGERAFKLRKWATVNQDDQIESMKMDSECRRHQLRVRPRLPTGA